MAGACPSSGINLICCLQILACGIAVFCDLPPNTLSRACVLCSIRSLCRRCTQVLSLRIDFVLIIWFSRALRLRTWRTWMWYSQHHVKQLQKSKQIMETKWLYWVVDVGVILGWWISGLCWGGRFGNYIELNDLGITLGWWNYRSYTELEKLRCYTALGKPRSAIPCRSGICRSNTHENAVWNKICRPATRVKSATDWS